VCALKAVEPFLCVQHHGEWRFVPNENSERGEQKLFSFSIFIRQKAGSGDSLKTARRRLGAGGRVSGKFMRQQHSP
jgi:hypothetical protein